MRIFLVGFMAVGKSFWGEKLANHMGVRFYDLDKEIELLEGMEIHKIFKSKTEDYFRDIEQVSLQGIVQSSENFVMACGGGTPCYRGNMQLMKESGQVVYLLLNSIENHPFLKNNDEKRPLTQATDFKLEMQWLLEHRKYFYEQSHKTVSIFDLTEANFAHLLLNYE